MISYQATERQCITMGPRLIGTDLHNLNYICILRDEML
jgi:hypothetical protein